MSRVTLAPLFAAAAAFALAAPAAAQHHGHMPGMNMPAPAPKKPAAKKAPARKPAVRKPAAKKPATDKPAAPKPAPKRPAPAKPADPHAGHAMPATTSPPPDPHAGHAMPDAAPAGTDLSAGTAPPPPIPTDRAADAIYGQAAMHMGRHHLDQHHGGQQFAMLLVNMAEARFRDGRDGFGWDAEGWYGGDIGRLWLKSEGEGAFGGSVEQAEVQALYSHAIGPYFNLQGGFRYDFRPDPSRAYAAIGVEGLAPGFFDVEGALFLSNKGELLARVEGHYDQRITQRLILQPRAELDFAAQSTRATQTGAGLSDAEIGLRLRYDIRRELAPYVGVHYERAFGKTRRYRREAGEDAGGWSLVSGVRLWF